MRNLPKPDPNMVGILKAIIDGEKTIVEFKLVHHVQNPLALNVALLGFDLSTEILAGENGGKTLTHDFVVLNFQQYTQQQKNDAFRWELDSIPSNAPNDTGGIAL